MKITAITRWRNNERSNPDEENAALQETRARFIMCLVTFARTRKKLIQLYSSTINFAVLCSQIEATSKFPRQRVMLGLATTRATP